MSGSESIEGTEEPKDKASVRTVLLGPVDRTGRGFEIIHFADRNGKECSLQQSSLADFEQPGTSAVWLGIQNDRMHIDYEKAKKLVSVLQAWIDTGSFSEGEGRFDITAKKLNHLKGKLCTYGDVDFSKCEHFTGHLRKLEGA
jgi:hypothetical protein